MGAQNKIGEEWPLLQNEAFGDKQGSIELCHGCTREGYVPSNKYQQKSNGITARMTPRQYGFGVLSIAVLVSACDGCLLRIAQDQKMSVCEWYMPSPTSTWTQKRSVGAPMDPGSTHHLHMAYGCGRLAKRTVHCRTARHCFRGNNLPALECTAEPEAPPEMSTVITREAVVTGTTERTVPVQHRSAFQRSTRW